MITTADRVPAGWLRTAITPQVALLVDYRNGAISLLRGHPMQVWLACLDDQPLTRLDRSTDSTLADFARRGWLQPTLAGANRPVVVRVDDALVSWGTQEKPARVSPVGWAPLRWRLAALPVLGLVLAVRQLGRRPRRFARLRWLTQRGPGQPIASREQAQHAVRAVRWAARLVPARVACLEESVTAALLLAAAGRQARWCHGIATDPVRLHAWIADGDGRPVDEPADTDQYTLITPAPTEGPEEDRT